MMRINRVLSLGSAIFAIAFGASAAVDFSRDIEPVLESKCMECHSTVKGAPKAGLRLDTSEGILRGSKKNKIIVPGKPDESLLYKLASLPKDDVDVMPPEGKGEPLTPEQLNKLREWIAEGCNFGSWTAHDFGATKSAATSEKKKDSPAPAEAAKSVAKAPISFAVPVSPVPVDRSLKGAARQIDELVAANYKTHNVQPNPATDDATFLRRIYLDAAGRIPTYDETVSFLESAAPNKREQLINALLGSEAYVSRQYNYWADLLRMQSRFRQVSSGNYQDWVKDSIRKEKPYDQFVRELLTADGHIYENGASGYYLRDSGMPLDNMANTVQLFLGTSLSCAQCHNHPFDKWTQKEFFEMAAFTAGVETVRRPEKGERQKYQVLAQMDLDNNVKQTARKLVRDTRYGFVSEDPKRQLRLPDNYKYEDAKPKSVVAPAALFNAEAAPLHPKSRLQAYADWMTSPDNPRFAMVIANRLWKQAMGRGLIEPVDDIKDDTQASNPALMAYLTELMKSLKYNQKEFLRIIYNTKTYQRQSSVFEGGDAVYHFPGPVLRRMSAEQIWDSVMTLTVPGIDQRQGKRNKGYGESLEEIERIRNMSPEELLGLAEELANRRGPKKAPAKKAAPEVGSDDEMMSPAAPAKKAKGLSDAMNESSSPFVLTAGKANPKRASKIAEREEMMEQRMLQQVKAKAKARAMAKAKAKPKEVPFNPGFVRASELQQPAPAGHFLEQFGQSDRETIEGANTTATVPQILTLLNGPGYKELAKPNSQLNRTLDLTGRTPSDMAEAVFLMIYNTYPTGAELQLAQETIGSDPTKGVQELVWALLNTQRFMFIR